MLSKQDALQIVVLKADRLYGELISRAIREHWHNAEVLVYHLGFAALESIQARPPDLFVTGVMLTDMDGLEHLEPFLKRAQPILVVTSRKDSRTCAMLRQMRFDGIYDGIEEGLNNLPVAIDRVLAHLPYISPGFEPLLKPHSNFTRDELTEKEQIVLAVIGDGCDDQEAADLLGLSPHTVNTHRKAIMAKLRLHQKGALVNYAMQNGYVHITPTGVTRPGFQRRLRELFALATKRDPSPA